MPTVTIDERGCRGCTLCVDVCPADVFEQDEAQHMAMVLRPDDCIGCYSCYYVCPSQCVNVGETHVQRPFNRIEENVAFVERFLQAKTATTTLTEDDWNEAYDDVKSTLTWLSQATVELMGRGIKSVGHKAGTVGASHLPEMYEEKDLTTLLDGLQRRFKQACNFEHRVSGSGVDLDFSPCGFYQVVLDAGDKPGEAALCQMFHEYLGGLLTAYTGTRYTYDVPQVGATCKMTLAPKS